MGQDRRLGVERRFRGNRRIDVKDRGYFGPDRRSTFDRRNYSERRQERYKFSVSTPF